MLTLSEFVNDNIVFENLQAQDQNLQAQNQETLLTLLYENSVAHLLISQEIFSQCINTEGVQTTLTGTEIKGQRFFTVERSVRCNASATRLAVLT